MENDFCGYVARLIAGELKAADAKDGRHISSVSKIWEHRHPKWGNQISPRRHIIIEDRVGHKFQITIDEAKA